MTQTDILLRHFQKRPDLSVMEAHTIYRIRSLPRRILDLEALGHRFERIRKKDATGQRYVRYVYVGHSDDAA